MILQKLFGKRIENRTIDYETALDIVSRLEEAGAIPIESKLKQRGLNAIVQVNPTYEYVFGTMDSFLKPYQKDALKGVTSVEYNSRDYVSHIDHILDFSMRIDNFFGKDLSADKGRFKFRLIR